MTKQITNSLKQMQDFVKKALSISEEEVWRNQPLEVATPTYYENWPQELRGLSFPSIIHPLQPNDIKGLLYRNGEFSRPDLMEEFPLTESVTTFLETAQKAYPQGFFIKLGSRAPKDSVNFDIAKGKAITTKAALDILLGSSERIYVDLSVALAKRYTPYLIARKWVEIRPQNEFRCFMQDSKLIGISQYNYKDVYDGIEHDVKTIYEMIQEFFDKSFNPVIHLDSIVFDVIVSLGKVTLIEINPFCNLTDPCLFAWDNLDGSFRYNVSKMASIPLIEN